MANGPQGLRPRREGALRMKCASASCRTQENIFVLFLALCAHATT